jgi:AraC-like DNA-binding protein
MLQRVRVPSPPLSDFVALLWLYDGWSMPHAKERALPDGSVELVINLREDETRLYDAEDTDTARRFSGTLLCGPHSHSFVIDTAEQTSVAGVHFRPGGAFPFLGMPADELAETHVSLETLWGGAARELRERVLAAPTADAKLDVLEETLNSRLAAAARHPAVAFALSRFRANPHAGAVARVESEIGLSPRRFIELFRREVGLTPKLFCRVRRFQRVLASIHRQESVAWADVAVSCGYYDQPHFIHDFRAFSGINPTAYLERRGRHRNHVPVEG